MAKFNLDPQLGADTVEIGDLDLCRVLMMNDVRYPWLILVPAKPDLTEIGDLSRNDRIVLLDEIEAASAVLMKLYNPLKLNLGICLLYTSPSPRDISGARMPSSA